MNKNNRRVLAIYPITRGFGYAVFEGRSRLLDWGCAQVEATEPLECIRRIMRLAERYRVDVVVTEDPKRIPHRCSRIRRLLVRIQKSVETGGTLTKGFSRPEIRKTFAGMGNTKHDIALAITARFPELAIRLPPKRKPWMAADPRMAIFDAVALAMRYFAAVRSAGALKTTKLRGSQAKW